MCQPKNLFEEMGGMDQMKLIVMTLIGKTKHDPVLGPFFHYTESSLYSRRLAHFFAHLTGATDEWIGKPIDEAHRGRFIKD
jgi:truncated hemoglobin YjbI